MQEPAADASAENKIVTLKTLLTNGGCQSRLAGGGRERLRGTAAIDTIERRITQPPTFISYPLRVGTVKTGPLTFIFATWHDLVIYHQISLRSWSVEKKVFR